MTCQKSAKGIVASSVNFSMMKPEMNLNLCEDLSLQTKETWSYRPLASLIYSAVYHSRNRPNIHLMIQQYGKGKSHFAVAIANFFKKPLIVLKSGHFTSGKCFKRL